MEKYADTLPASQRIKSRSRINALFEEGKSGLVYPLRYIVLRAAQGAGSARGAASETSGTPGEAGSTLAAIRGEAAVMVSVPKRNHKRANVRNLLKRRMREAYRLNKQPLRDMCRTGGENIYIGLIYVAPEILDYAKIEDAVRKIIRKITQGG